MFELTRSAVTPGQPFWWHDFCTAMLPLWENLAVMQEQDLYQQLLEAAVATVPGVEAGSITVLHGGRFRFVAALGYDLSALRAVDFAPEEQWGFGRNGQSLRVLSQAEIRAQRYDSGRRSILEKAGRIRELQGVLVAPVRLRGKESAYLYLDSFSSSSFPQTALELTEAFARQLSLLVDRQHLQEQIRRLAFHDPLTDLLNRRGLEEAVSRLDMASHAVVMFDLKRFRLVNQRYGHLAGDTVLRQVVAAMQAGLPARSLLCRWGGDEFVLAIPEEALEEYLAGISSQVPLGFSAGIAGIGDSWEQSLVHADFALRQAKIRGGIQRFDQLKPLYERQRQVVEALEGAFGARPGDLKAFRLDYQPVVQLDSPYQILFIEALLRFAGAPPLEVLALAEQYHLLHPLTEQVVSTALREARRRGVSVSVNLSPAQLVQPALLEVVQSMLRQYGLPGSRLVVEITEAAAAENTCIKEVLRELRGLGVQVWLDDFGNGHSSLERLSELPIDGFKLSHGFARSLGDERNQQVALGILSIARGLRLPLVVEGIETPAQAEQLRALGFVWGQGFLYSQVVLGPGPCGD